MAIQLFVPTFDVDACMAGVRECLESGWTGAGSKTLEFEEAWAKYTGHRHAHFLNSATAALHLALNVFKDCYGWADGDEVITTSLTFVATNHAILYEGLTPVFADVDRYLCLDPEEVERRITPRTRAVMFVGLGGNTGQLPAMQDLCRQHGLLLILDAAHMAGTTLHGKTPDADAVCYSFQAVKNLPTADAGMLCLRDAALDAMARHRSWFGIDRSTFQRSNGSRYAWKYEIDSVGFKYHGNAIMAAIGLAQLPHLEAGNDRRRSIAAQYEAAFRGNAHVCTVPVAEGCVSSRHLFQILIDNRDEQMRNLNARGIFPGVHYRDNTDYPMYASSAGQVPRARAASWRTMSLPLHLQLTDADVATVAHAVNEVSMRQQHSLARAS